ncbi:hypothetical protein A374_12775 [Fictibacillus macauensis ZFHKF-1]|uniref:Thioesterase domain-containing protein n=1 Tax=Fictibacillus macauensis ZFHKF-1 TaxID=1196324 RepID=I8UDB8_9BACL|nr:PaaI family thioesterase [Fictibacillus macauensis]EIT84920.1 hypothetical protein A374_12775 [Fictibacillus macauensis ZFHKF-1]
MTERGRTMELIHKLQSFLNEASEEEAQILSNAVDSLQKKRETPYASYISSLMNMEYSLHKNETLSITIPITPFLHNTLGMVHGGLTATLMDTAMGALANITLADDEAAVTSEMKVNYTSPGVGKALRCDASIVHKGRRSIVTEARVYGDHEELIALSTGTFFVVKQ